MKTLQTIMLLAVLAIAQPVFAQNTPPAKQQGHVNKEKIESLKVSYFTEKLSLTPEEAQKFWPVYNKYKAEIKEVKKSKKAIHGDSKPNFSEMSDKDIAAIVDQKFADEQKILDIRKKYHEEFKKVLPVKKVATLYRAEEQFKRELLKQVKGDNKPEHRK